MQTTIKNRIKVIKSNIIIITTRIMIPFFFFLLSCCWCDRCPSPADVAAPSRTRIYAILSRNEFSKPLLLFLCLFVHCPLFLLSFSCSSAPSSSSSSQFFVRFCFCSIDFFLSTLSSSCLTLHYLFAQCLRRFRTEWHQIHAKLQSAFIYLVINIIIIDIVAVRTGNIYSIWWLFVLNARIRLTHTSFYAYVYILLESHLSSHHIWANIITNVFSTF